MKFQKVQFLIVQFYTNKQNDKPNDKGFISFIISIEMSAFIFISEHTKNTKNQ